MNSRSQLRWTFADTSLALFAFRLDRLVAATALPAIRTSPDAQVFGMERTVRAQDRDQVLGDIGDRDDQQ
jgi:hypothetical protein